MKSGRYFSEEPIRNLRDVVHERGELIVNIDTPLTKQYRAYASIEENLEFVSEIIIQLLEIWRTEAKGRETTSTKFEFFNDNKRTLKRSLFITSIITYMRCFTKAQGRGTTLNEKDIFKNIPEVLNPYNFEELHMKIENIRNNYIAHAGNSDHEDLSTFIKFELEANKIHATLSYKIINVYNFDSEEMESFFYLIKYLKKYAERKQNEIVNAFFKQTSEEEIKNLLALAIKKNDTC